LESRRELGFELIGLQILSITDSIRSFESVQFIIQSESELNDSEDSENKETYKGRLQLEIDKRIIESLELSLFFDLKHILL